MRNGSKMKEESRLKMIRSLSKVNSYKAKPIIQIDAETRKVATKWRSVNEIKRILGFEPRHIIAVLRGRRNIHKGFIWRYA